VPLLTALFAQKIVSQRSGLDDKYFLGTCFHYIVNVGEGSIGSEIHVKRGLAVQSSVWSPRPPVMRRVKRLATLPYALWGAFTMPLAEKRGRMTGGLAPARGRKAQGVARGAVTKEHKTLCFSLSVCRKVQHWIMLHYPMLDLSAEASVKEDSERSQVAWHCWGNL